MDQVRVNGSFEATTKVVTPKIKLTTGAGEGHVLISDAVGNATWQAPPQVIGFSAYLAENKQEFLYSTGDNLFNNLVEDYDQGDVLNPTNGEFTAPSDGFYHFDVNITWIEYVDFKGTIKIKKNGQVFTGSIYESYVNPTYDTYTTFSFSVNTKLETNDVITVWFDAYDPIYPTRGVVDLAPNLLAGGNTDYTSTFSGFKIH
jgi:hypothetical protein